MEQGEFVHSSVVKSDKIYMRSNKNGYLQEPNKDTQEMDEILYSKEWYEACVVDEMLYYYDIHIVILCV